MQSNENTKAKKALKEIGPFINKTLIAAEIGKHPNTIGNYINKNWTDEKTGIEIFRLALKQFLQFKANINAIDLPSNDLSSDYLL